MTDDRARYQEIFLDEARAHIETMEHALVALEQAPQRMDLVHRVMRAVHSLKGDARMMGYEACSNLAHHIETPLQRLRQENKAISPELIALLFRSLDTLEICLANPLTKPPENFPALLEALSRAKCLVDSTATVSTAEPPSMSQSLPPRTGLRVNSTHLDTILHLVEEMVMNQSALTQLKEGLNNPALDRAMSKHKRLLAELRDAVLQTRLVPAMRMFAGFPRLVRDVAADLGKEATLVIEGAETELDRALLEPVRQMVGHLLRNAVVHGIEPPEERQGQGKLRVGTVRLAARRERNHVVIEVSDDGRGLDAERIIEVAQARGDYTSAQLRRMPRAQLWRLLCEPGFSTLADGEVSNVAGRGMGLDAVKQSATALRGELEISSIGDDAQQDDSCSTVGSTGARFALRLPLTLAIVEALLVEVGAETYAIPETQVRRVVPLTAPKAWGLQDVALHSLRDLLEVPNGGEPSPTAYALVLERGDGQDAVVVDKILSKEDIVIKPLRGIQTIAGIAGATVLGEGQVVLVLDALKLW